MERRPGVVWRSLLGSVQLSLGGISNDCLQVLICKLISIDRLKSLCQWVAAPQTQRDKPFHLYHHHELLYGQRLEIFE